MVFSTDVDKYKLSRDRGTARGRALQRLACRHPREFQRLWEDEAEKMGTTAGRFRGVPERAETDDERNARLAAATAAEDQRRQEVIAALIEVL